MSDPIELRYCGQCRLPIKKGEDYYEVPLPTGGRKPVHEDCLSGRAPSKREG